MVSFSTKWATFYTVTMLSNEQRPVTNPTCSPSMRLGITFLKRLVRISVMILKQMFQSKISLKSETSFGFFFLRNERDVSFVPGGRHKRVIEKLPNSNKKLVTDDDVPKFLIKFNVKPIETRELTRRKIHESEVDFLHGDFLDENKIV